MKQMKLVLELFSNIYTCMLNKSFEKNDIKCHCLIIIQNKFPHKQKHLIT